MSNQLYKELVSFATPLQASIKQKSPATYDVIVDYKCIDCEKLKVSNKRKLFKLTAGSGTATSSSSNYLQENELATAESKNGKFVAKLKADPSDPKKQTLEIWGNSRLLKTINVSELKEHGLIKVGPQFSSMQWDKFGEGNKLLYVCQSKDPRIKLDSGEYQQGGLDEHTILGVMDVSNNFKIITVELSCTEKCLMAIKQLIEERIIRADNLIIQGNLDGALIAAYLLSQSEVKFKCAIIQNPILTFPNIDRGSMEPFALMQAMFSKMSNKTSYCTTPQSKINKGFHASERFFNYSDH